MKEPVFKRKFLEHYQVIQEPGSYIVKVANTVKPEHLYIEDEYPRYIVNLRATTEENLINCVDILGEREECVFEEVNDCFISGTIWENDLPDITFLPNKGESVVATYDLVDDIMRCISLTLIPRKTLQNFDPKAYNTNRKLFTQLIKIQ